MTALLQELKRAGEVVLGRSLRVEVWRMPQFVTGVAWTDLQGRAAVAVSQAIVGDAQTLRQVFYHEVAHHKAGDVQVPKADPTWQALSQPFVEGYSGTPRERFAESLSRFYQRMEVEGQLEQLRPGASVTPAAPSNREMLKQGGERMGASVSWLTLAEQACAELKTATPILRRRLDALPPGAKRDGHRLGELEGYTALGKAPDTCRTAKGQGSQANVNLAEQNARRGARQIEAACVAAAMACPANVRRLARGEGAPVQVAKVRAASPATVRGSRVTPGHSGARRRPADPRRVAACKRAMRTAARDSLEIEVSALRY